MRKVLLLFAISKGKRKIDIDNDIIIYTEAPHTVISQDAVTELGVEPHGEDELYIKGE